MVGGTKMSWCAPWLGGVFVLHLLFGFHLVSLFYVVRPKCIEFVSCLLLKPSLVRKGAFPYGGIELVHDSGAAIGLQPQEKPAGDSVGHDGGEADRLISQPARRACGGGASRKFVTSSALTALNLWRDEYGRCGNEAVKQ